MNNSSMICGFGMPTICTTVCTWKNEEKTNVKTTVSPFNRKLCKTPLDGECEGHVCGQICMANCIKGVPDVKVF